MSPRTAKRRPSSCSEYLHQAHRKTFWLAAPDAGQSSKACCELGAVASSASDQDSDAFNHRRSKKRKGGQSSGDVKEEQVTRDLCKSFRKSAKHSPEQDVTLWKSASTSSNGVHIYQSGLTTDDDREGNTSDGALATVRTAAELLTQLTANHNVIVNSNVAGITSAVTCSPEARQRSKDEPIRWGFRKKVSYDSRRSVDSCDLGLSSGQHLQANEAILTTVTTEPDQQVRDSYVPYDFTVKKWKSSPNAVNSDLYQQSRSSIDDSGARHKSPSMTPPGRRDRLKKAPSTRAAGNILKLPKDMQGRWSSERYKSAQLKLIDIMHSRKAVPGKPILRPALREEARKHIGDTGLLDHLLKHMTDTVVSTGERFRRRHNSEGAMEYWLEHASLMELRKAAGVEDPSWIPPPGWKPGDRLPGKHWHMSRGMTTSEASEMKILKETVEKLKSEMKTLCGRIKRSNQSGERAIGADVQKRLDVVSSRVDEALIERIKKDMIEFRAELTTLQEQIGQEQRTGSNFNLTLERFQKLESEVLQISEDQRFQHELLLPGNKDLEGQLQDVRNAVNMMQADVSYIMKSLGFAPPPLIVKATPIRHQMLDTGANGNAMALAISADEGICPNDMTSSEPRPSGIASVGYLKQYAPLRQCTVLESASSSGGNTPDSHTIYTEGLSRTLSNYNLVYQSQQMPHIGIKDHKNPVVSRLITNDCGQVLTDKQQIDKLAVDFTPPHDYRGALRPTGFKVCRPPGSFIWPSMMNLTHFNSTFSLKNTVNTLDGCVDDGCGSGLPRPSGLFSVSPTTPLSKQINSSARSVAESHVAATMAGMFGCMAPQQGAKLDSDVSGNSGKFVYSPREGHAPVRNNHSYAPNCQTWNNGLFHTAPSHVESRQMHAHRQHTVSQSRSPAGNSQRQRLKNSEPSLQSLATLPLMGKSVEASGKMDPATRSVHYPSMTGNSAPALSLSLSLSLGSSTPGIDCGKSALKKQKSL